MEFLAEMLLCRVIYKYDVTMFADVVANDFSFD